jgi:hypothetical protein
MRPDGARVLFGMASRMAETVLPEMQTPIGVQNAGIAISLALALGQEFDRLVDRLLVEASAVAAILKDAAPLLEDGELRARALAAAARTVPANYRVSTVQALNDSVRAALIDVHAAIEQIEGEEAAAMNDRIWAELQESTRRRQISLGR